MLTIPKNEVKILEAHSRKLRVLASIVERYVITGDPVGSKAVCEDLDLSFSSATIRSEMADLVDVGYLFQPHVSAGRIPSYQGYRLYINKLMTKKPLSTEEKNLINGILSFCATDPESLFESAAKVLAEVTGFAAIITAPPSLRSRVRDIRFVKTGTRSAMIVLMASDGMIKNKLFRCDYDLNEDILQTFGNILNEKFRGEPLISITSEHMNFIVGGNKEISFLFLPVIDVLIKAVEEACETEVKIAGQKNLLSLPGIPPQNVVDIFNFLENKDKILRLLDFTNHGIKFTVGEENIYSELKNASIVSTRYNVGDKSGVIGIIGPTRMDYAHTASQLSYVASLVGALLARMLEN